MSFFYGSDTQEIHNPFKKEGLLFLGNGVLILIIGLLSLFSLRTQIVNNGAAIGWVNMIICFILIGLGLTYLGNGLLKVFRFYVGRNVPGNLTPQAPQSNSGPFVPGRFAYQPKDLEQMLMGRNNPTFAEPVTFSDRLIVSMFPKIIFLPHAMRNYVHTLVKKTAYSLIVITIYLLALLSGSLGLTHITQSNFAGWSGIMLMAALFVIWINNKISIRGMKKTGIESLRLGGIALMTVIAVMIPAIAEMLLRREGFAIPAAPFHPAFYLAITYLLMAVVLVGGIMLALQRANMMNPLTEVSEYRGHWQENVHPKDIFRSFDLELANLRFKEIPNRVYRDLNPNLNLEGSFDKGSFKGDTIQETQPVIVDLRLPEQLIQVRWIVAVLGHVLVLASAVILYLSSTSLPSDISLGYVIRMLYMPAMCWVFGSIAINIAHMYWAELNFKSYLIHFFGEGTYSESKLSVGMAITDSTRSENHVVRSSFSPWIVASEITTSTLAGSGTENLEGPRYVMNMRKADDIVEFLIKGIRKFLDGRQLIADMVSDRDMDAVHNLYAMNQGSPSNLSIGVNLPTAGEMDEEKKKKLTNPVPPKEIEG